MPEMSEIDKIDNKHSDGPIGDKDLPLTEHIDELRNRMVTVLIVFGVAFLIVFAFFSDKIMFLMWNDLVSADIGMIAYEPLEVILTRLKLSLIFSLFFVIPLTVYEAFKFMDPGLYPHEKRFFLMVVPSSFVLFLAGVSLGYFAALPEIFKFTILYGNDLAIPSLSVKKTYSIITNVLIGFGLTFQFPMILLLAIKIGLVELKTLKERRLWVYGGLLTFTMIVAPDPTGFSQLLVVGVLVILYEISMLLARFIKV